MIVAQIGMEGGLLLTAIGIIITLLTLTYQIGSKITEFENTLDRRLTDINQSANQNTDELSKISSSLTKIEVYFLQNNNGNNGAVQNDGGRVVRSKPNSKPKSKSFDLPDERSENWRNSHNPVSIDGSAFILKTATRMYVSRINLSVPEDTLFIDFGEKDMNRLRNEISDGIREATSKKADVEVTAHGIEVIIPTTDQSIVEQAAEELVNIVSEEPVHVDRFD